MKKQNKSNISVTPNWFQKPETNTFQFGQESQFGSSRGVRFGPLRINKTGISANNGTVDSVVVNSDGFHGYNDSNNETIAITPSGAAGYGTDGTAWTFTDVPGGTIMGAMGYNTTTTPVSYTVLGTASALMCGTLAGNSAYYTSSGNLFIACGVGSSGKAIYISENGGASNQFSIQGATEISDNGLGDAVIVCGTGIKTAIMPTSKGYNALYCTESPEVWFMDFARYEKKWWQFWKKGKIICDEMFLEVTSKPYIILPTLDKNIVQIWGKRKGLENKRFEQKTKEDFDKNNAFWDTPNIKSSKSL